MRIEKCHDVIIPEREWTEPTNKYIQRGIFFYAEGSKIEESITWARKFGPRLNLSGTHDTVFQTVVFTILTGAKKNTCSGLFEHIEYQYTEKNI